MFNGDKLQNLRKNKGLTQKNVALDLGITERAYQGYEIKDSYPSLKMLIKLANYFNVSTDYLLDRTNNPKMSD